MEIKVGDKVRVSKGAQKIFMYGLNPLWFTEESTVVGTHPDGVVIKLDAENHLATGLPIPTKYLIKVEDEAKEPKFKVGDVVRIRPDADKLHQGYQNGYAWLSERDNYLGCVASVKKIWCDGSIILNIHDNLLWEPVDLEPYTEPTAPTIKIGDRVCCYNILHLKGSKKEDYMGIVTSITDMGIMVQLDNGGAMLSYRESDLELVQPKEQTEAEIIRQREAEFNEFRKAELDRVLHPEKYYTYEVSVDNVAMDWQRYEADLAKEIALKVANKKMDNYPEEIGAYAVRVAKAVVEGLKRK